MTILSHFNDWLNLPDATKYISNELKEEISLAHLLRFGLEGKLTLSVSIPESTPAFQVEISSKSNIETPEKQTREVAIFNHSKLVRGQVACDYSQIATLQSIECEHIAGVFDLPLIGAEYFLVQEKWPELAHKYFVFAPLLDSVFPFLKKDNGNLYVTVSSGNITCDNKLGFLPDYHDALTHLSLVSEIVIRHTTLKDFAEFLNSGISSTQTEQKQLEISIHDLIKEERNKGTDRDIIAALLKENFAPITGHRIAKFLDISQHLDDPKSISAAGRKAVQRGKEKIKKMNN